MTTPHKDDTPEQVAVGVIRTIGGRVVFDRAHRQISHALRSAERRGYEKGYAKGRQDREDEIGAV